MEDFNIPPHILRLPEQVTRSSESRLASAGDARAGFSQLIKEDAPRSYQRAIVKACLDGADPFNAVTLKNQGMGWRCNMNFRGLEGIMDSSRIPYYQIFSGVPTYANFKTSYEKDTGDAYIWEQKVADKFTCLLDRWDEFNFHVESSQYEMLFEGWGPLFFENDSDWRFRSIPANAVLVPQRSPSCVSPRIPFIVVKCEYRIHELYAHIRDPKGASDRGWNVGAVRNAIKYGTKGASGQNVDLVSQPWEEWERRWKSKELMGSYTEADLILCAHFFVKEFDGKISHFIITQGEVSEANKEDDFLFRDVNRYDSYSQVLNVSFQNTGDGRWHSVQGIGIKAYKSEEVQNRLMCRTVDNSFLSSAILLQANDSQSAQKAQMMITGALSIIPPGLTYVDRRIAGDIESVLAVQRVLENRMAQKIGAFNQRSMGRDDGRGEQPTATQVNQAAAKEGSLSASQIENYYGNLDTLYSEVFRRVMISSDPEAKRFRNECVEDGVPMEALKNMEYVRANRLSGYGSPGMRKMAMQELMAIVPMMNEKGKNNALNELIASGQGVDKIPVFNPPMEEPDINTWAAIQENDSMHNGVTPVIIPGMDHVTHLTIHLGDAEQRLEPLRQALEEGQQLDPSVLQEAFQYVTILGQHCEDHLSRIENDPTRKQLAEMFEGKLKMLVSFHGELAGAIKSAEAAQEQAQREKEAAMALSAKQQVELQGAQQDMQIDAAKAQNDIRIKNEKALAQTNLKRWQAGQKNKLDTVQAVEGIRLERAKTAATIDQKRLNGPKTNGSKTK